ncbi:DNRLRE domain-containing protein [Nocardioides cavernaquae]|uniref:DNRLRE domain-containing protein n=1 Tax=Nocardioides cavernaquae TaxID=2321396 RepID=UPI00160136AC|nr:DNRLRE domain-containing protein [Nocardioides cavernaquae]
MAERPDAMSAALTARSQGKRVEDTSQRTERSSTWANPDGTWTTENHLGVQRFKDSQGKWVEVNLDLAAQPDGSVEPVAHPLGLKFPGKGPAGEIRLDEGQGRTVSMVLPGELTKPTVDGLKATYADVAPGVDVVLESRRTGFEQTFVLDERPTEGAAVSWDLQLKTKGLTAKAQGDGSINFVDAKNKVVSHIPAAVAWDSRVDEHTGEPVNYAPVTLAVTQRNPGHATLRVSPDAAWLVDPATQFPVTIDPTYTSTTRTTTFDTYVTQGVSSGQSSSTKLKLGKNGAGDVSRSFLEFELGTLKGRVIKGASLKLYENYSWNCSARSFDARDVSADVTTSTVWSNQPTMGTTYGTLTDAKGHSSECAAGWSSMAVTSMVQAWAADSSTVNRVGLRAQSETDSVAYKEFGSLESSTDPYLSISYNNYPGVSSVPTVSSASTYASTVYSSDTTPAFFAAASDGNANNVSINFQIHTSTAFNSGSLVTSCNSAYVASGAMANCTVGTALADNTTYFVRTQTTDGMDLSSWSTAYLTFKMAAAAPSAPMIVCPTQSDGAWSDNPPANDVACTISAAGTGNSAPGYISYSVDGALAKKVQITPSSDPNVAKVNVTVPKAKGGHGIAATAISRASVASSESDYGFGYGTTAVESPATDPVPVTTGDIKITADSPPAPSGTTASSVLKWRLASTTNDETTGWNTAQNLSATSDPATGGLKVSGTWNTMAATTDAANGNVALDPRLPATLELQVCTTYTGGATQCTWNSQPLRVLRVPHAFGAGFPVADAGPGQVALWTGEFTTAATDVVVPGYTGSLSISRTHATFAGEPNPAAAVFGPGWTASLDGSDAGLAGFQLIDNTLVDGTLVLYADDADPMVFAPTTWTRRTGTNLATGTWNGVDEATADAGVKATVTGSGTSTVFSIVDPDGVTTTFKITTAATATTDALFAPESVTEPGSGTTTYTRDPSSGRVTRILAPVPPAVTCTGAVGSPMAKGCRALDITYATTTTATSSTPGDVAGQVKKISLNIFNPAVGGSTTALIDVATYKYDDQHRLVTVTDPRPTPALTTSYAYDSSDRLTSLTPAGLAPYNLEYAGTPTKLARVKRDNPASAGGGTATLATVLYDVPTSGTGLPDLSANGVAVWGQPKAPTYAAAVFGPDKPITTLDPAAVATGDWSYASIQATDARGYTINTAEYGPGKWLPTFTQFNDDGYPILELDAGDIQAIKSGESTIGQAGTLTVYNTASNGPAATPVGSIVTDTYGPTRWVTLKNGDRVQARPHTAMTYDEASPDGGINPDTGHGWALPTTISSGPVAPDDLSFLEAAEVSKISYGSSSDTAAWKLGAARTQTTVIDGGSGDITTVSDYDSVGRVIAQRQPTATGSDAGTRKTIYYTVGTNADDASCGNKPEWAGAACRTYYAGQASGQDLISTKVTGYNAYLSPTTTVESANGGTRTTTATYDTASRPVATTVVASGISGSTSVKGSETTYDSATGLPIKQWATTGGAHVGDPINTTYDSWGRALTYEPSAGEVTTTTFDSIGRITQVVDPKGTTSYGYGYGADANGDTDRRGLPTTLTVTGGPGGALEFGGAYNADGTLVKQKLPGGLTQTTLVDAAGEPVSMEYTGQVTIDNGDGTTTIDSNGGWLGWSTENDINGRVRREWTPAGAAFTTDGLTGPAAAAAYDRAYKYDKAGRLTQVDDRTSTIGAGIDPITGEPLNETCETRAFSFDKNGNRLSLSRTPGNADGTCQTPGATGVTTKNWSYDAGDRLTGGYVYDAFGRQTTIPATDAPVAANGAITLGYTDTDAVASITQNGQTTGFALDQAGRRQTEATGPIGQAATSTTTRHYTDGSDNPGWSTLVTASGTATTRYAGSLGGDLGLTLTNPAGGGTVQAELALANPHGDVVTTANIPAAGPCVGITGWADGDEYGNKTGTGGSQTDGLNYGWLGAKERATQATGLMLMGVRVYNPATGSFSSTDPVFGGNTTAYAYPQDPVNRVDLDGRWGFSIKDAFKKAKDWADDHKKIVGAVQLGIGLVALGVCAICTAAAAISYGIAGYKTVQGYRRGGVRGALGGAASFIPVGGRLAATANVARVRAAHRAATTGKARRALQKPLARAYTIKRRAAPALDRAAFGYDSLHYAYSYR